MSPWFAAALTGLGAIAGCQSTDSARPAVLTDFGPGTQAIVAQAVSEDLDRANIAFGTSDPTKASQIVVLPPPPGTYETSSPALPITYDILMGKSGCYLVRDQGAKSLALPDGICRLTD